MLKKILKFILPDMFPSQMPEEEDQIEEYIEPKKTPKPTPAPKPIPVKTEGYALLGAVLTGVDPRLMEIAKEIIDSLRKQGFEAYIHNGMRTQAQADANAKKGIGIKNSKHVLGKAVDIIDKRYAWNDKYMKEIMLFRAAYGKLTDKYPEITWGGNWNKSYGVLGDWAHIELK